MSKNGQQPSNEGGYTIDPAILKDASIFSAQDYMLLYPDVKIDPWLHYVAVGYRAGRKPCRSHIDYSKVTPERIEQWKSSQKGKFIVCTSLTGGYERLLPPAYLNDGWSYVCYADQKIDNWGIWDMRPIPYENADLTRKSRWAKMRLPELFPDAEWVLWLDSNVVIADDLTPLIQNRSADSPLFSGRHPTRDCLYEEARTCMKSKKDDMKILLAQISSYRKNNMPKHFGLYENNVFLMNPKHPQARNLFVEWWEQYEKYSKRDQVSLPYALYRNNITPGELVPDGEIARRYPGFHFLTHEETFWIPVPDSLKSEHLN